MLWFDLLYALCCTLTVGPDFQAADKQGGQDVLGFVVRPDTDAAATRGNVSVIMRRNLVLASVRGMHNERQEWLSSQSIANVLRHDLNLPKKSPKGNTDRYRPTTKLSDASGT